MLHSSYTYYLSTLTFIHVNWRGEYRDCQKSTGGKIWDVSEEHEIYRTLGLYFRKSCLVSCEIVIKALYNCCALSHNTARHYIAMSGDISVAHSGATRKSFHSVFPVCIGGTGKRPHSYYMYIHVVGKGNDIIENCHLCSIVQLYIVYLSPLQLWHHP